MFLVLKLLGSFLAALVLWNMYRHHPRVSFVSTVSFVMIYTVIVAWNLSIFFVNQA